MPKIPAYQPGQVGSVKPNDVRLRAPDTGPSGFGRGMQDLGQALGQYAEAQDRLLATSEDTQARAQAIDGRAQLNGIRTQFQTLQGGNAVDAQGTTLEQLRAVRDQAYGALTTPRMKKFFDQHFGEIYADAVDRVHGHALQQVQVQRKGVFLSELADAQDSAGEPGLYREPDKFMSAIGQVRQRAQAYADFAGMTGEAGSAYVKEQAGSAYEAAVHQAIGSQEIDFATDIFNAHHDEMTVDQKNRAFSALQKPLQEREYASIFRQAATGAVPAKVSEKPGQGGTYQMPVDGRVTNTFAQHEARGSAGLDVAAPLGSAIHPIAGGTITAVTQDDRAGRWVMVKHPDGTSSTYAHMGNQSVKVGDEVSSASVLGTVGVTGHTTGPHVHLRVRDASGADVDPETIIGSKAAAGRVVGSADAARNYDQATVISHIKAMGLSPEKERGAVEFALGEMRRSQSVLDDQYRDAGRDAALAIGRLGDNFTSTSQIPRSILERADPTDVMTWAEVASRNAEARTKIPEKGPRATELQMMQRLDKEGFLKVDLSKEVGKVAPDELLQFSLKQADIIAEKRKPPAAYDPRSGINAAITWGKKYGSVDVQDTDFPKVYDTMDAVLQGVYKAKGRVEQADYDSAFKAAVRSIPIAGFFGGSMKAYDVVRVDQIPDGAKADIERTLKQTLGRNPNDRERLDMYRRMLAGAAR